MNATDSKRHAFTAFSHRNYRLWFVGQLVSLMGTWMQNTAQGFLVFELTQSAAYLGYVALAACRRRSPQRRPRSPIRGAARRTSRRLPSRNAAANWYGRRDSGYGTSSGSTNEIPVGRQPETPPRRRQTETIAARTRLSTRIASAGRQNPQRRCRSPGRAASEHHVKHRHDRQQRHQQIEPVRAGEGVRLGSHIERTPTNSRTASHKVRPGTPLTYYPPRNRQPDDDVAPATPRPNGAHTLGTSPTLHHERAYGAAATRARTRRRSRYRPVPRAYGQDRRIPAAAELTKNDRFRSRTASGGLEPGRPRADVKRGRNSPSTGWSAPRHKRVRRRVAIHDARACPGPSPQAAPTRGPISIADDPQHLDCMAAAEGGVDRPCTVKALPNVAGAASAARGWCRTVENDRELPAYEQEKLVAPALRGPECGGIRSLTSPFDSQYWPSRASASRREHPRRSPRNWRAACHSESSVATPAQLSLR